MILVGLLRGVREPPTTVFTKRFARWHRTDLTLLTDPDLQSICDVYIF